ncbi:uncharacterized protein J3D65DRAFT_554621 [Phyllosticta citribraziliensis]|uniref:Uncharacterized protein n=1 Tax=Phyllosticta citribraziliensis TaxID=989973 RepID=A0ABR1LPY5_9PEZI
MQHFAPHPRSAFEGYYSKFKLPSGSYLALIICSVPKAPTKPHMVSFTYVPTDKSQIYQREIWVEDIERVTKGSQEAFELRIPRLGTVSCIGDSTTRYSLSCEFFSFDATVHGSTRVPWNRESADSTPEGLLVHLPLPLHWHVHTLGSLANFRLSIPENLYDFAAVDRDGVALVHQEKNWASSFPSAHIWIQACEPTHDSTSPSPSPCPPHSVPVRAFCLAGGHILGTTAFLLSHHPPSLDQPLTFAPPFAMRVLNFSPFMSTHIDWASRRVRIEVRGWSRKINVRAQGEKEDFFGLSAPFADGHRKNWCAESFNAEVEVETYKWRWCKWRWERVSVERFEKASLEFGGEWYGDRGDRCTTG